MSARALLLPLLAATLFLPTAGAAHDYWMEQAPQALAPGDPFRLHMLVGDDLRPEVERPYQADMTTRFELRWPGGATDLTAGLADSTSPMLEADLPTAGFALVLVDRRFHTMQGTVADFLSFLEHEGQSGLGARYEGVDPATPLRRRYARNLKAWVSTGQSPEQAAALLSMPVGQELELLLAADPVASHVGGELAGELRFRGEPLAGQPMSAMVRTPDGEFERRGLVTGERGEFRVALDRPGQWVLRVAHLLPTAGDEADWDTHYAVLSFWRGGSPGG